MGRGRRAGSLGAAAAPARRRAKSARARRAGNVGIGHVRYPTAGSASAQEAQPFFVNSPLGVYLIHNGNLTNVDELREALEGSQSFFSRHLRTDSDSEARARRGGGRLELRGGLRTNMLHRVCRPGGVTWHGCRRLPARREAPRAARDAGRAAQRRRPVPGRRQAGRPPTRPRRLMRRVPRRLAHELYTCPVTTLLGLPVAAPCWECRAGLPA